VTCTRSQEFLETNSIQIKETINASQKLGPKEALSLAKAANEVICAKGKKIVQFKMSEKPKKDDLLKHMLGPTGNLRAPVIVKGKKVYIGFPKEGFEGL
jgi:arsenate reductase-like glutaredoxin family protein